VFVNQIYISSNIQNGNLCHRQGRLQQTNVIVSVSGKAHSKLHSFVMQVIMTHTLTLTVTQLSRHCTGDFLGRTVLTDELCAVQASG
jgi:hypothetical protein